MTVRVHVQEDGWILFEVKSDEDEDIDKTWFIKEMLGLISHAGSMAMEYRNTMGGERNGSDT